MVSPLVRLTGGLCSRVGTQRVGTLLGVAVSRCDVVWCGVIRQVTGCRVNVTLTDRKRPTVINRRTILSRSLPVRL